MGIFGKAIAVALALVALGGTASAQTLKVGSKNFTEQFIVAELYAAALEAAGFKVERKINLGATLVAHEALRTGAIDLYPEYTGTGLGAVMKAQGATETAPQKVYQMVKAFYEKEYKLTWLKPSGVDNGYALVVRPTFARMDIAPDVLADEARWIKAVAKTAESAILPKAQVLPTSV